jgi:Family of unknown function (DUF6220)
MSEVATPDVRQTDRAPIVQRIRLVVLGLFLLGIFVQFYLAGRGAFGASSFSAHRTFGDALGSFPPAVLVLTLLHRRTRNRVDVIHAILLVALFEVQYALADLDHPGVGAFHPVNGLLILLVALSLFRRDLRAVRSHAA